MRLPRARPLCVAAALVLPLAALSLPPLAASAAGSLSGSRIDDPTPLSEAHFGFSVAGLGDVDGDGTADLAVGAPGQGVVYVVSGSTHAVLHKISDPDNLTGTQCEPTTESPSPCDFGLAVASAGDVDIDGVDDIAVGAPGIFGAEIAIPCIDLSQPCPQEGRAFVFSGRTGTLLKTLAHDGPNQGAAIVSLGSIDGDQVPDFAVVAPGDPGGTGGLVAAFAGSDGHELWTTLAPGATQGITGLAYASAELAAIPDVDGEHDVIVGAPCYSVGQQFCVGRAYVLSGASGATLRVHDNPAPLAFAGFGSGVAGIGDQNADGVADYAVSDPGAAASAHSQIHLYSGATGMQLLAPLSSPTDERNEATSSRQTMTLTGVDDKDGDGAPDFWLGAASSGAAYLLNKDGHVLETASDTQSGSDFGLAMSAIPAPPGEPGLDVVVGAPTRSVGAVTEAGSVFLLRAEADLQVSKSGTPATIAPGGTLTYDITVFNAGPSVALGISLTDPISAVATLDQASLADDPTCGFDSPSHTVTCAVGALAPGATFKVEFRVTLADNASVPSTVVNTASVTSLTTDPAPGNNISTTGAQVTCDVVGTPGDDVLVGTAAGETVCGLGGDDVLIGLGANDVLVGGDGDDTLIGNGGDDTLLGGPGNDRLFGQGGNDSLFGGAGDDRLYGGPGDNVLDGGPGSDFCKTQAGAGMVKNCETK